MALRSARAPQLVPCLLALAALTLVIGCGGAPKKRPTAAEVDVQRQACAFAPGQAARDTLPDNEPVGRDLPIEHIILIMQENRSFDHYYSELDIPGLDVAARTDSNPDSMGNPVPRFHFDKKCMGGGDHGWVATHQYYNGGKNDGFVTTSGDSHTPMGYYDGNDLPYYYALAKTFAFSDRHFSSAMAPTWPNRMFYFAGTSWGHTSNVIPYPKDPVTMETYPTLFNQLDAANVDWRVYAEDHPTPAIVALKQLVDEMERFLPLARFETDVAAGTLAPVTLVEASDVINAESGGEGPPADVDIPQKFVSGVIGTIMNSPFWKNSVIFLSYDENGGMYDHALPPPACKPDDIKPDAAGPDDFDRYGYRVPFFVVSPYARRGYLSHHVTDHTSILRFVEARFGIPAMTRRDANADAAFDMFDFEHPDFSVPALPEVQIDRAALADCIATFGGR
jgi:phospholipase C